MTMTMTTTTIVEPFRLVTRRHRFKFEVSAPASGRSLKLSGDEALALKCLVKERAVGPAAERLRRLNANNACGYTELVRKLIAARLIHKIDGHEIEPAYASWWVIAIAAGRHRAAALPMALGRSVEMCGSRIMPLGWMLRLTRLALAMAIADASRAALRGRVRQRMGTLLVNRPPAQLDRCAQGVVENRERMFAELTLLQDAPNQRLREWVTRLVHQDGDIAGVLKDALATGRGAIVFSYHMGPMYYIPIVIRALGFRVTLLGMSLARARKAGMFLSIVDDLRPAGLLKLLDALRNGDVVVMAPDVDVRLETDGAERAGMAEMFAGAWGRGSRTTVRLFDRELQAYAGLAWLHAQSGAPLVFAAVTRDRHGQPSLACNSFVVPELPARGGRAWTRGFMAHLYRHYQSEIEAHPEAWLHWLSVLPESAGRAAS